MVWYGMVLYGPVWRVGRKEGRKCAKEHIMIPRFQVLLYPVSDRLGMVFSEKASSGNYMLSI